MLLNFADSAPQVKLSIYLNGVSMAALPIETVVDFKYMVFRLPPRQQSVDTFSPRHTPIPH